MAPYNEYWYLAFLYSGIRVWRLENVHSQQEANNKAMIKLGSGRLFYAFSLNTKDMNEATKHARAWFVENGAIKDTSITQENALDQSLHRAGHKEIPI